jgi:uncharacterized protein (DUF1330 family)
MGAEITRELLQTTPLADLPGWEVRLFLISYPPGADANNHSHPVVGVGFVLEGVMVSAFDDAPKGYIAVIGFESVEKARGCYGSPAYEAIKHIRQSSTKSRVLIVEGATTQ